MTTTEVVTTTDRRETLAAVVQRQSEMGWKVISQTETQAQLVKGKPTNHLLHLILSVITIGFWIPVWICVAIFTGEKRRFVNVDAHGRVSIS